MPLKSWARALRDAATVFPFKTTPLDLGVAKRNYKVRFRGAVYRMND